MKWTYSLKNKFTASIALFVLCLLVLLSNYIDRNHTDKVKKAISTLYEDRIIVEGFILKMTSDLYGIKEIMHAADSSTIQDNDKITAFLADIDTLSQSYLETKFTEQEDVQFEKFLTIIEGFNPKDQSKKAQQLIIANNAILVLRELSDIQLDESKLIMERAEGLYNSGRLIANFAFGVIIIILVVLQALVITSKPIIEKDKTPVNLN